MFIRKIKFFVQLYPLLTAVIGLGIALRVWLFFYGMDVLPQPDVPTYISLAAQMSHLYDTGFREPFFVWWCRFLQIFLNDPHCVFQALRFFGTPFFVATCVLTFQIGRRLFSTPIAISACFLLAINWAQIDNDMSGLRNSWEGLLFMILLALFLADKLSMRTRLTAITITGVCLSLLRLSYFPVLVLLLPAWFWFRKWKCRHCLWMLPLIFLCLVPHYLNNNKISNDPFLSANIHAANFRNVKFAGQPGFPTKEEVALNAFAGPPETVRNLVFKHHTFAQIIGHTLEGIFDLLWGTATTRFFAKNTSWLLYAILLPGFVIGTGFLLMSIQGRLLLYTVITFVLPFAFFKHIHWSYRLIIPLAPLVSLTAFWGLDKLMRFISSLKNDNKAAKDSSFGQVIHKSHHPTPPQISFLVPVYNESKSIVAVLERLQSLPFSKEIVVVDDGSKDGTREKLSSYITENFVLVFHPFNQGKGKAIQTALAHAQGAYVAIQDADLEYAPEEYSKLLDLLQKQKLSVVYGSRFLEKNPNIYKRFLLGNKVLTGVINLFCRSHYTDTYTCYKLMERKTMHALQITSSGFEMEAEISAKVALRNISYAECPITYKPRRLEEGKKIGWQDAVKGIWTTIVIWWNESK